MPRRAASHYILVNGLVSYFVQSKFVEGEFIFKTRFDRLAHYEQADTFEHIEAKPLILSKADHLNQSCSFFNKAGYTATPVACGWAGAILEVTRPFGQEQ